DDFGIQTGPAETTQPEPQPNRPVVDVTRHQGEERQLVGEGNPAQVEAPRQLRVERPEQHNGGDGGCHDERVPRSKPTGGDKLPGPPTAAKPTVQGVAPVSLASRWRRGYPPR